MSIAEYRQRRERLMQLIGPGAIAVLPSAKVRLRNRYTEYPFRQDSDFYYLTGFDEPNAVLVLSPGREHGESILFCEERDPDAERWTGERLGPDRAAQVLGVDDAFPIGDVDDILPGLLEGRGRIHVTLGVDEDFDRQVLQWVNGIRRRQPSGIVVPGEFVSLSHHLHDLRLFKSAAELKLMRRAAEITAAAHVRAMRACRAGLSEADLEAELVHEFMRSGARFPAYPCIVAAGRNASVMHYTRNDAALKDGELVLIDAGCEYRCYASDVTRTFPVNGQYTAPQRAIYEIVLDAQLAAIAVARKGEPFDAPHRAAIGVMVEGLLDLGLMEGDKQEIIEQESYKRFCLHRSSHWLGLDVHDVGDYRLDQKWRVLEPGMTLTVEPGLYVPDDETVPRRFRGIGVRIEDDVLITARDNEVLTAAAPKTIDDVEAIMRG